MASTQDILNTPATGYNYIDALLAVGPDWNFLTADGSTYRTTLYYSFDTGGIQHETTGLTVFNAAQQQAAISLLEYISLITGIHFAATQSTAAADFHFALADIENQGLGGVCYVDYSYRATTAGQLTSYSADAYIYLDSVHTADPAPAAGSWWYQALLHELGHALGLKHPFESDVPAGIVLNQAYTDSTQTTVMSYTQAGDYTASYGPYDLAALNFLYGEDGLGGAWGVGENGVYLTGSPLDDTFTLPGGTVMLADTGGTDTVYYGSPRSAYTITPVQGGEWLEIRGDNIDHLISASVEQLVFADSSATVNDLLSPTGGFVFGTDRADQLTGNAGSDMILGGAGSDLLIGNGGNDLLHGGDDLDRTILVESADELLLSRDGDVWTARSDFREVTLISVERLQLADGKLALDLDVNQAAGQAALLTAAALGRGGLSDTNVVGLVLGILDSGVTLQQASELVVRADWFKAATGGTDTGFVQTLLHNVLGATPPNSLYNEYLGMLQGYGGNMDQAELFAYLTLSDLNQQHIDLVGLQQSGLMYA